MNDLFKNEIILLIESEKKLLGSNSKVATKTGVSKATISQMRNGNWELIKDEMWLSVASSLGYQPKKWNLATITNYRMLTKVLSDAKTESMFFGVSHSAGSGKTATINNFAEKTPNVYVIQAREWARREFLLNLAKNLGIDKGKGYVSVDKIGMKIITFFKERSHQNPMLIIDEADKLKPSALRYIIPFFNYLDDSCGLVIAGTDNLEKEIKRGVRYNKKGYDEIDSRLGRNFIHLLGATKPDVHAICSANGILDKSTKDEIFNEASPKTIMFAGAQYKVIADLRRVKRIIKRHKIKQNEQ